VIDPLPRTAARIHTFEQQRPLTNASGFFFERDERLFLVTSRHVLVDEPTEHYPNRLEIELHTDPDNLGRSTGFSIPLYRDGKSAWRQTTVYRAFTPDHLHNPTDLVEVGTPLLIVGFPLGFHDALHHMPVVRHAVVASSFGLRFQGQGYFLTDARTHRGTSGSPVVMRVSEGSPKLGDLPWMPLGVHSARIDLGSRDLVLDEALGLNCAWYADILMTLTSG
jgi:hypothetical protein